MEAADGDRDGMPNTLLEAMALGTPCLTTRVVGIPEFVIAGETGSVVEPHDAEALADKLVQRDRESDDRRLCLECPHLSGFGPWRCNQWRRAGLGQPGIPGDLVRQLQRCNGFSA